MSVVGICTMALVAWHDDKLYLIVKPSAMLTHCLVFLLIYNIDWDLLLMNAFFTPFGIKKPIIWPPFWLLFSIVFSSIDTTKRSGYIENGFNYEILESFSMQAEIKQK